MTYAETLDWLYGQLPMYQNKGKAAFNSKLDGILALSAHLNNPHKKFKSIHIAGTNGKGSSSHMLASILQEAGYKVGLYTSPHLKDFRERIRINGEKVSKKYVVDFVNDNYDFFQNNSLSFFEMTVGMAFSYFANKEVDIAVIEVGLGGRLDSTNIITPEVSLITNIGFDHTDMLGDTLPEIAMEKAGIIKNKVPVVISEYKEETASVFKDKANGLGAHIVFAEDLTFPDYKIGLLGSYQRKNSKGVLAVLEELKGFQVSRDNIGEGLQNVVENTGLMGRWQQLGSGPKIICDTAHNKEGLLLALKQVTEEQYDQLHILIGFVKGKDINALLPLFPKNARYYYCCPKISRGLDSKLLCDIFTQYGFQGRSYSSVNKAFKSAKSAAEINDFIYVGGSNFVVSEVL